MCSMPFAAKCAFSAPFTYSPPPSLWIFTTGRSRSRSTRSMKINNVLSDFALVFEGKDPVESGSVIDDGKEVCMSGQGRVFDRSPNVGEKLPQRHSLSRSGNLGDGWVYASTETASFAGIYRSTSRQNP